MVLKATVQKHCPKQSLLKVSSEAFFKINFLKKKFSRQQEKTCVEYLSNEVVGFKAGNLIKKRL